MHEKLSERGISNSVIIAVAIIVTASLVGGSVFYLSTRPKPNFKVKDLSISREKVAKGVPVTAQVRVANVGDARGTHTVRLKLDGQTLKKEVTLEAGESRTVDFDIEKQEIGTYSLNIEELSETFEVVEPAQFGLSGLQVGPGKVAPQENVEVSVKVANVGEASGVHTVELKINGSVEESRTVTLGGGESTELSFLVGKEKIKFYQVEIGNLADRFEVINYKIITEWGGPGGGEGLFHSPAGTAIDDNGYVYVADTLNNRIQKFTAYGSFVTMWGKKGNGPGEFDIPLGVAVDDKGFVYVAEGNGPYVQKFTSDGDFVRRWKVGGCTGVAVDKDGHVYVAASDSIQEFTADGEKVDEWGSKGSKSGQFINPSNLAVGNGYVYVVELNRDGNHRVQKFTTDGEFLGKWNLEKPRSKWWPILMGITVDLEGNIYVSNPYSSTIKKFDLEGNVLSTLSDQGDGIGEIKGPSGIAINSNGDIYVSEGGNYRIQKFDPNFNHILHWGSFGGSGSGHFNMPLDCDILENGYKKYIYVNEFWNCRIQKFTLDGDFVSMWGTKGRDSGEFENPEAITVDSNGIVYVSDSGNHRIQKFDSEGNFITEWGSPGRESGEFRRNVGIAVGPDDEFVYVVDMGTDRVQKFKSDGTYVTQWKTESTEVDKYSPRGIAVDGKGNVYVSEEGPSGGLGRVQKFTSTGGFLQSWNLDSGTWGGTPHLYDISIDIDNNLYVVDTCNGNINKFTPEGTLLGKWNFGGNGIAVDSEGYVYMVNTGNDRVLKLRLYE